MIKTILVRSVEICDHAAARQLNIVDEMNQTWIACCLVFVQLSS